MLGGLGWSIDLDVLGSIPNRNSLGLPNTQFWWVGSLSVVYSLGVGLASVRFHIKKKSFWNKIMFTLRPDDKF